ncbi:MAG: hypothetical protein AMS17_01630 [Spirochaetes bacterium DG_61]|jgi:hypothetical protein|nr:MAG: hypothetical protein AMS17_01630 [Spirochaetes bacterium DG_61]
MYMILVKDNSGHKLVGIAETKEEVKACIKKNDLQDKIDNGKAYLVEGTIRLIRPETTPELLDIKEVRKKKNGYY